MLFTVFSEILASSRRLLSNIGNDVRKKEVYRMEELRSSVASPFIHLFTNTYLESAWYRAYIAFLTSGDTAVKRIDGAPASVKDTL